MLVPLFSASIWAFTQASESEGHVVSNLLTQSAQLFCESHWWHLILCPTNESKNSVFPFSVVVVFFLFFYGIGSESFTASILCFRELHLGIPWKFNLLEFPEIARNKRCF